MYVICIPVSYTHLAQFINKLGENRIDFSQKNKDNLAKSIEKIGVVIPSGIFNVQAYTLSLIHI